MRGKSKSKNLSGKSVESPARENTDALDLSEVFNAIQDMICIIDDHQNIIRINVPMAEKLKISREEAVGKKCYELLHGTSYPPYYCPHAKMLNDRQAHEGEYYDERMKCHLRTSVHPFKKEGRNFAVHVLKDITEKKISEEAVQETFSKYKAILDNLGVGISLISPDLKILELSKQMKIWFPHINIGDKPYCYKAFNNPPRDSACEYCPTIKTFQDGMVHESITQTPSPFGMINYRVISSPVIGANGKITGAIEIVEDITERLILEEKISQSHKLEAIGRLAGGIAHDFNNVIQVIISAAEFAVSDLKENLNVETYLKDILDAANRSSDLTRQLLAFGRKQFVQPHNIELNKKIQESLKIIRRGIPENIQIDFIPYENLNQVYADPVQVEQVLLNLCLNAKDAMLNGGMLKIWTENAYLDKDDCIDNRNAKPGVYAMIAVSDTGTGIAPEELAHIFEPFFTTKLASRGTGLGLATVYGIVQQHKGIVDVTSEIGKGATFRIYLPSVNQASIDVEEKLEDSYSKGGTETVLLVEDDFPVHKLMKTILELSGYKIFSAEDGEEAMNILKTYKGAIDLALLDVVLPKFSGKELAEKIMIEWPEMKILFCTGYSREIVDSMAQNKKNIDIIEKPFRKSDLLKKVRDILDQK